MGPPSGKRYPIGRPHGSVCLHTLPSERFFRLLFFLELFFAPFFRGTFAPFLRASESPIAIACLRLFTVPPFPPLPLLSVPFLRRSSADLTLFEADFEYLRAIGRALR